jgi:hypothetical protein
MCCICEFLCQSASTNNSEQCNTSIAAMIKRDLNFKLYVFNMRIMILWICFVLVSTNKYIFKQSWYFFWYFSMAWPSALILGYSTHNQSSGTICCLKSGTVKLNASVLYILAHFKLYFSVICKIIPFVSIFCNISVNLIHKCYGSRFCPMNS